MTGTEEGLAGTVEGGRTVAELTAGIQDCEPRLAQYLQVAEKLVGIQMECLTQSSQETETTTECHPGHL